MATSDSELFRLAQAIQAQVRTLINIDLKEICRAERLPVSGVKSTLQQRIFGRKFHDYYYHNPSFNLGY